MREKISKILGDNFELIWLSNKTELNNNKIFQFKFINKSGISNREKLKYINDKIELLKANNFIEIEDLKISGIGRFIKIEIKTIQDYELEKIKLEHKYLNKIKLINEKINNLLTKNN